MPERDDYHSEQIDEYLSSYFQQLVFTNVYSFGEKRANGAFVYPKFEPAHQIEAEQLSDPLAEANPEKHVKMSLTDFELAINLESTREIMTESAAISAIKGVAGHMMTAIATDLTRQIRNNENVGAAFAQRDDFREGSLPYEALVQSTAKVLEPFKKVYLQDVPLVTNLIWQELKQKYVFFKKTPNSLNIPLLEGQVFSADWVQDVWNSNTLVSFEESLVKIYDKRIQAFLDREIMESGNGMLPIESDPEFNLTTEKLMVGHADFSMYRIQFQGQADFLLKKQGAQGYTVVIDQKYTHPDHLFTLPMRLQALMYSHLAANRNMSRKDGNLVSPENVMFLYHVFDTRGGAMDSYYLDATVYPTEYPDLMGELQYWTLQWWFNRKEFEAIKKEKKRAIVMPHLPSSIDELVRPIQKSLIF